MSDSAPTTFRTGDVVNRKWVILELVGQGGMGEVYRAYQLSLQRDVAVKVISQKIIADIGDDEEEVSACLERFRREVRVMAQVQHPNVLKVFDFGSVSPEDGESETVEYIIMEYLPGPSLRTTMSAEGFYPEEDRTREWLLNCYLPVLNGVSALHRLGIIHRDLKPENVLFDGPVPKIADFGLSRSCRLGPITRSVDIKGTPAYMSPEHFLDFRRTDERADVYSLGKILFEAISGKITSEQIPFKQAGLKEPAGPFFAAIDEIIRKATCEDKQERFQSVEDLRAAIEKALAPRFAPGDPGKNRSKKRIFAYARALVPTIALAALTMFAVNHYAIHPRSENTAAHSGIEPARNGALPNVNLERKEGMQDSGAWPPDVIGRDTAAMHLIPGGEMPPNPASGEASKEPPQKVKSFYMDETLVTNYQFIEFLNDYLQQTIVKDNAVFVEGHPWILLGEVVKGYEPIIFRRGKFQINGAQHSSCPVLRVTAYGASAYAARYDKRLPTESEWAYVAYKEKISPGGDSRQNPASAELSRQTDPHGSHGSSPDSMFPTPVLDSEPDIFGIRGLNGYLAEWAVSGDNSSSDGYVVLGGTMNNVNGKNFPVEGMKRGPWDSSEEIGFRTVSSSPR